MAVLTPKDIDTYFDQGYLVKKGVFSTEEIDKLVKYANEIQNLPEVKNNTHLHYSCTSKRGRLLTRTENFLPTHTGLRSIFANNGPISSACGQILEEKALIYKDKLIYKLPGSPGFNAHQDGAGYVAYKSTPDITVQVAIDKADRSNGCLNVISGYGWDVDSVLIPEDELTKFSRESLWKAICAEPGDVLFMGMHVPHYSEANKSLKASRRTFYVTYIREGKATCKNPSEAYFHSKLLEMPPIYYTRTGLDPLIRSI